MATSLAPKQQRFVDRYLVDLNATKAYMEVYGATERVAAANAARLLTNAKVAAAIAEAQKQRSERTQITADQVLAEFGILGFSNIWHYKIDDDGHVALAVDAPPEAIRAVQSIKRKRRIISQGEDQEPIIEIETEIKLWDKPGSLRSIGDHLGMFKVKHELSGKVTLEQLVAGSYER